MKAFVAKFCPITGDWGKLGIPNLARMYLMKCYRMLQNYSVTAFTISESFRENQKKGRVAGMGGRISPHPNKH